MQKIKFSYSTVVTLILVIALIILYFQNCSGREIETVVVPDVKGSFKAVKPTPENTKPIPVYVPVINNGNIDKTAENKAILEAEKFKKMYHLSQVDLDRLVKENVLLDSLAQASNDKRYQELYANCKAVEFSQLFDNDTLKATVSGIAKGVPERLKLDWQLKSLKQKNTVFRLSAGGTVNTSKNISNTNGTGLLSAQFKNGNQILLGISTNNIFSVGGLITIFNAKN